MAMASPSLFFIPDSGAPDDPHIAYTLLFEEFVPLESRSSLIYHGNRPTIRKRLSIASLLGRGDRASKPWRQVATPNGKPYSIGNVAWGCVSPSTREQESKKSTCVWHGLDDDVVAQLR